MAVTAIVPEALKTGAFDLDALAMTAAASAEDGFAVDLSAADHKTLFVFQNTGASARTATVKAGNALQGVSDLTSGDIAAGKFAALAVESGKYKHVSGTLKGKVLVIPSHAELKMTAIALP